MGVLLSPRNLDIISTPPSYLACMRQSTWPLEFSHDVLREDELGFNSGYTLMCLSKVSLAGCGACGRLLVTVFLTTVCGLLASTAQRQFCSGLYFSPGGTGRAENCGDSAVAVYQHHRRLPCHGAEAIPPWIHQLPYIWWLMSLLCSSTSLSWRRGISLVQTALWTVFPQLLLDKVVDAPVVKVVNVVKIPVVAQRQFPVVLQTIDIPQLLDTVIDVLVAQVVQVIVFPVVVQRPIPTVQALRRTRGIPHLVLNTVIDVPVVPIVQDILVVMQEADPHGLVDHGDSPVALRRGGLFLVCRFSGLHRCFRQKKHWLCCKQCNVATTPLSQKKKKHFETQCLDNLTLGVLQSVQCCHDAALSTQRTTQKTKLETHFKRNMCLAWR